ncbi:MAG: diguanylate cyclase domain-containing protein, partial [Lachnospiraceae bacterium]
LEQEVERREIKFRLTISIGSVRLRPDENIDIEKYLQMADEAMYRVKDVHHRLLEEKQQNAR